jgi:Cu2+-exporting ATPase
LGELAKLLPDTAERLSVDGAGGVTEVVPIADVVVGDLVIVRPGSRIAADGQVTDGRSDVDESLLTGESTAVEKSPGSHVVAGSISSGALNVRVTRVGGQTALAGIMRLVAEAQSSRSRAQVLADRAAAWLFYLALAAAIVTAVAWSLIRPDDPGFVLERVVTVLVIACPHALGLAIPLVAQISTALGARRGILVRDRLALESARAVDVVLFDKTGTLTEGKQGVTDLLPSVTTATGTINIVSTATGAINRVDPNQLDRLRAELLGLAAAVEQRSEHAIGRAIVAEARARNFEIADSQNFESLAGRGAQARVYGRDIAVLSPRSLIERGLIGSSELVNAARDAQRAGKTVVFVVDNNLVLGMISLADVIRPESAQAVASLKAAGVRVAMLTGDSSGVAQTVATQLGITEVFAEVLPGQKSETVAALQADGSKVAMVGDGVNDAPALARADVGIAIGAGTEVAIESAGIVLASNDPRGVAQILHLSKDTYFKMQQNLAWAVGYNVVAIPLAAGVTSALGWVLSPAVGAVLMSVSTIVVALNAQLLRRVKL